MEGWTTFYQNKKSKKGLYLRQGTGKNNMNWEKVDFQEATFRAILSNFKALLDVSSFALNTHI